MTEEELEAEFREFRREYNTSTFEILQGYFVGYQGKSIKDYELINALDRYTQNDEVVKSIVEGDVFLGKIVPRFFESKRQPINRCNKVPHSWNYLVVGSHNSAQALEMVKGNFCNGMTLQGLLCNKYARYKSEIFEELKYKLDFSAIIYDKQKHSLIAGNTTQYSTYSTLYYGYIEDQLIFSNNEEIIDTFCDEIFVMPPNAYMQDGLLYWSNGQKLLWSPERVKTTKKVIAELEGKVASLESKLDNLEEKYNMLLSYYLGEQEEKHISSKVIVKKHDYNKIP